MLKIWLFEKINAQKSLAFLYANNKRSERELKETIPFTISTKRDKRKEKLRMLKDVEDRFISLIRVPVANGSEKIM